MKKTLSGIIALSLVGLTALIAAGHGTSTFKPKNGFVPTKEVAIKIALAVWEPIYGPENIAAQKPYEARLTNGDWFVTGSLAKRALGGVAEARIAKEDGRIISITHGQ